MKKYVLIFENRLKNIEIYDPLGLLKADTEMPIKVSVSNDTLVIRRCEAHVRFIRGVFFSDIHNRLLKDIFKSNLHYRGRNAIVLRPGEEEGTLVDADMSDEEILKAFPGFVHSIGNAGIVDAGPSQVYFMEMLENEVVYPPEYRTSDHVFLTAQSMTESSLKALKDTLNLRQRNLLEKVIENALLLIETISYQEHRLGWRDGTDCLVSALKVRAEEDDYND